jgi:hypothetical protein
MGRRFLVTCAHVVAPPGFEQPDTIVDVAGNMVGRPLVASKPLNQAFDAALIELSVDVDPAIGDLGLPAGWGKLVGPPDTLRAYGAESKAFRTTVLASDGTADIRYVGPDNHDIHWNLAGQLLCERCQQGGDSGAAVLNANDLVVGLVVGFHPDGRTVVTPIGAVLDFFESRLGFKVEPIKRPVSPAISSTAGGPPIAPAGPPIPNFASAPWSNAVRIALPSTSQPQATLDTLAWTLWGEAATDYLHAVDADGIPLRELCYRAVAEVVVNRSQSSRWKGKTIDEICTQHSDEGIYQFTCWDSNPARNSNFSNIRRPEVAASNAFRAADWVARRVVAGWSGNLTFGARHYFADYIKTPNWAEGHEPCAKIGHHLFFNDVA